MKTLKFRFKGFDLILVVSDDGRHSFFLERGRIILKERDDGTLVGDLLFFGQKSALELGDFFSLKVKFC